MQAARDAQEAPSIFTTPTGSGWETHWEKPVELPRITVPSKSTPTSSQFDVVGHVIAPTSVSCGASVGVVQLAPELSVVVPSGRYLGAKSSHAKHDVVVVHATPEILASDFGRGCVVHRLPPSAVDSRWPRPFEFAATSHTCAEMHWTLLALMPSGSRLGTDQDLPPSREMAISASAPSGAEPVGGVVPVAMQKEAVGHVIVPKAPTPRIDRGDQLRPAFVDKKIPLYVESTQFADVLQAVTPMPLRTMGTDPICQWTPLSVDRARSGLLKPSW
jgi:hypothetical protein